MKKTIQQMLAEVDNEGYGRQARQELIKVAKLNRARSREMEKDVAKILNGFRIPMSGSGGIKGDVTTDSEYGRVFVECKMSAARRRNESSIRVQDTWFTKLEEQAIHMRSPIAVLVIKFHGYRRYWVFMYRHMYEKISGGVSTDTLPFFKVENRPNPKTGNFPRAFRVRMPHIEAIGDVEHQTSAFGQIFVVMSIQRFCTLLFKQQEYNTDGEGIS